MSNPTFSLTDLVFCFIFNGASLIVSSSLLRVWNTLFEKHNHNSIMKYLKISQYLNCLVQSTIIICAALVATNPTIQFRLAYMIMFCLQTYVICLFPLLVALIDTEVLRKFHAFIPNLFNPARVKILRNFLIVWFLALSSPSIVATTYTCATSPGYPSVAGNLATFISACIFGFTVFLYDTGQSFGLAYAVFSSAVKVGQGEAIRSLRRVMILNVVLSFIDWCIIGLALYSYANYRPVFYNICCAACGLHLCLMTFIPVGLFNIGISTKKNKEREKAAAAAVAVSTTYE